MLTTVPFDRLSLRRLPWVTFAVVLVWLAGFVYAASAGPAWALSTEQVTAAGLLGHWVFQATGAQLLVGSLLLLCVGPVLEEAWGPLFFAAFLLAMAVCTAVAYTALPPDSTRPLVGSAGMLAAALGACIARQLKDGIHYTAVYWHRQLRHVELWVPAYVLPGVWFAGEVIMELGAQGVGPTRGLSYSGQAAGAAAGALVAFCLRHYGLEQSLLRRRPADAPDPAVESARALLSAGSPEAALRALQPAVAARPQDPALVAGLCEAAVAAQQPEAARAPFLACISQHLKSGEPGPAAQLWKDWGGALGSPAVDGRLALPLAEALVARAAGVEAARVLRELLDAPARISTGMALRIVEIARPIHAGVAIRAARLALEGGDFPEAKRARLEAIVRELETRRADQLDPQLDPNPPMGADRSIEIALEEEDLSKPPPELRVQRSEPIDLPPDWPDEGPDDTQASSPVGAALPDPTAAAAAGGGPDERDQLFGSSHEVDLAAEEAMTDPAAALNVTPVGVASRGAGPGRTPAQRKLMPLQTAGEAPPAEAGPAAAPSPSPPTQAPAAPPTPGTAAARPHAAGSAIASAAPRFQDAKCIDVVPVAWEGQRISLRQGSSAPAWLDLAQVQAIASAGVSGLAVRPVVLIDLLLNWRDVGEAPLRVLRLRSDHFDPSRLVPGNIGGLDGFRALLDTLIDQSGAIPLPDERRGRGRPFARFDGLEHYEREVLGIDR